MAIHLAASTSERAARPAHRTVPAAALLLLVVVVAYVAAADRSSGHLDFWSANFASWNLVHTGSAFVDDVAIPPLDDNPERFVWMQDPAPNGHAVIARSPGVVAAGLPGYWLLRPSAMTLVPAAMTAALLASLAVGLVFLSLRGRLGVSRAAVGAGALALATPMWTISANGLWPHTITGVGIGGMAWAAATRRWWLVGAFGGVAIWGRMHTAVIVAILGLVLARRRNDPTILVKVAVPSGLALAAESIWSAWMYGSWNPMASYGGVSSVSGLTSHLLDPVNHLGMWVAPDRGILVWSPVVLLLLPGLVRSWRELPDWSQALLVGGLVYTLLQSSLISFTGGDYFYGYRLGLEFVVCAAPALCMSAARAGPWAKRLLGPVLAIQTLAMGLGAMSSSLFVPEAQVWTRNAFVDALHATGPAAWFICALVAAAGALTARALTSSTTWSPPARASARS